MTGQELAAAVQSFGLTNPEFARLAHVSPRAVQLWLSGQREIPGPVNALARLFAAIPDAMRAAEIARLRNEETQMFAGFFLIRYSGTAGQGTAMLVFDRGTICGADEGGGIYDGDYTPGAAPGTLDATLTVTIPPGVPLVQGVPALPFENAFEISCTISAAGESQFDVATPYGPVVAHIKRLRDLARAAA
jgi:hypothetical protein